MNLDHQSCSSNSDSSSLGSSCSQDLLPNVLFDRSPISCSIDVIDRQYSDSCGAASYDIDTTWDPPTHPELFPGAFVLDDDDGGPSLPESPPPALGKTLQQYSAASVSDDAFGADAIDVASASVFKEPPPKRRKPSMKCQQKKQQSASEADIDTSRSRATSSLPSNQRRRKTGASTIPKSNSASSKEADDDAGANLLDKVPSYLTALSTGPKVVPCNDKTVLTHQAISRANGTASYCLATSATPEEAPEAGTCSRLPGYTQEFTNSTLWDGDSGSKLPIQAESAESSATEPDKSGSIFKREYSIHGDEEEVQQRRILFIGHLPKEWADPERELQAIFKRQGLGPIREISVKTRFHRHLDSYAFVYFLHRRDAYAAYDYLQKAAEFRQLNVGFGGRWQYLRGQQYTDLDSLPSVEAESGPVEDLLIEASDVGKKTVGSGRDSDTGFGASSTSYSSSSSNFGSLLKNYVKMRGGLHY